MISNNEPTSLSRHIIVGTILIVLLIVVVLIQMIAVRWQSGDDPNATHSIFTTNSVTGQQIRRNNCDLETVYSMTDEHCNQVCATYNQYNNTDGNIYVSRRGVCLNTKIVEKLMTPIDRDDGDNDEHDCDPKNGVLAYIVGDTQFGKLSHLCLSIDVGVQPDDGTSTKGNTLCQNGTIDIDYNRAFPQLTDCTCSADDFLALIPNTSTIRARGVCVDKSLKKFYETFTVHNTVTSSTG